MKRIKQIIMSAVVMALWGMLCVNAAWAVYSQDFVSPEDLSTAARDRVVYSSDLGGFILSRCEYCMPYLWVPNGDEGTVSKIDARSGKELARYRMGPRSEGWSPTSVALDASGNAYVACGSSDFAGKIVKIYASGNHDTNADGQITTSWDSNGDNDISPTEIFPWGMDDRASLLTEVGGKGSYPSSVAFDNNGYLWVSLWGERSAVKVSMSKKSVVATVPLAGRPGTTLVGPKGSLLILCRDNKTLCEVNPITCTLTNYSSFSEDCSLNGMCIDDNGKVWIGSSLGLICFDPTSGTWSKTLTEDGLGLAGVAVDKIGDIWAACPNGNKLIHFSGEDGSVVGSVPVGKSPGSVCMDEDNYMWSLNEGSNTASRVDCVKEKLVSTTKTGNAPFSSTPFSTFVVKRGTSPDGKLSAILDSGIAGAGWGTLSWDSDIGIGDIKISVRSAEVPAALDNLCFQEVENGKQFEVANGRYLEVKVAFAGNGEVSPILRNLHVEGRNLAPDISKAIPTTGKIVNTDHSFESIGVTGVVDPEGDPVTVVVTSVTQDEPVAGLSDDDKAPDAIGIGSGSVWLRGECDEGTSDKPGNGRVYVVAFKATDSLGASSSGKVKVTVPVDPLSKALIVDDGQKYQSWRDQIQNLVAKG